MPDPNSITPPQLMRLIGTPACPALIDICLPEDFAEDPRLIPGARRASHRELAALRQSLNGGSAIIICQKGRKLSQGVVSALQAEGVTAEYLAGGVQAWQASGGPLVPINAVPFDAEGQTRWITRARPKIDRIACPWLIRRFVDRRARFLFVAPSEVMAAADIFDATPFDIDGAEFSHEGDLCSFDVMLRRFGLGTPALEQMALAIREADTNRHDLHPVAAGLLAISVGLSRQYKNDHAQLEAAMPLYDALYRWARDGQDEGHDWPHGQNGRP
ncbi:chromate resistance protein ChrB domain-containing protein [Roseovarius nanhaiticus]|uniref:chromate resistance protein ChrB domain-containing protein n=1 Tax=Roseovarius nanhaiticus TaxID=573024 RepID=UPI00249069BB|nr:chromate resistance protein ChrB domain-containing protein [Roseovarius nanhaiticus]